MCITVRARFLEGDFVLPVNVPNTLSREAIHGRKS